MESVLATSQYSHPHTILEHTHYVPSTVLGTRERKVGQGLGIKGGQLDE